jgi:hypothetical protein
VTIIVIDEPTYKGNTDKADLRPDEKPYMVGGLNKESALTSESY